MKFSFRSFLIIVGLLFFCFGITYAQNPDFSADSVLYDGWSPKALLTEDYNGDNFPDIAELVLDFSIGSHIAIFLNDGSGTFNSDPDSIYMAGDFVSDLAQGDLNNDGIIDLAVSLLNDSSVIFWYGNGDGTFSFADSLAVPTKCKLVAISDFNNDDNGDIAVSDNAKLIIFLGNDDSTFSSPASYSSVGDPRDLEVFDMNNDGYNDLIAGNGGGSYFYIHYSDSSGGFSNRQTVSTYRAAWYIDVCDFNSDAFPDIAAGSGSYDFDNVFVLVGDSEGNYTTADTASPGSYVRDISACDLNIDYNTDILMVDNNGMYAVLANGSGKFVWTDTLVYEPGDFNPKVVYTTDLNNDEKTDVIVGRVNKLSVYYNETLIGALPEKKNIINSLKLFQNYPNPFNPSTTIKYFISKPCRVLLKLYDIAGKEIHTFVDQYEPIGEHSIAFNAEDFASGVYIYKLRAGSFEQSRKMVLLR